MLPLMRPEVLSDRGEKAVGIAEDAHVTAGVRDELGDYEWLEQAAEKLDTLNMQIGVDMGEATAEVLAQVSKST